jgi:hypothetical protein
MAPEPGLDLGPIDPEALEFEREWLERLGNASGSFKPALRDLADAISRQKDLEAGDESAWLAIAAAASRLRATAEAGIAALGTPPTRRTAALQTKQIVLFMELVSLADVVEEALSSHPRIFAAALNTRLVRSAERVAALSAEVQTGLKQITDWANAHKEAQMQSEERR